MRTSVRQPPVQLFVCAFSADNNILEKLPGVLASRFGPVDLTSEKFLFNYTDYYTATMGEPLHKIFFSFQERIEPNLLADVKLATNAIEEEFAVRYKDIAQRPLNLDPGYLEQSKIVLATTKNYSHRIYLAKGIYVEVTLYYSKGKYLPNSWTYPDYASSIYNKFFLQMRERET